MKLNFIKNDIPDMLEVAYNVHRWYWVTVRIAKSYPSHSNKCFWGVQPGRRLNAHSVVLPLPRGILFKGLWTSVYPLPRMLHCPISAPFSYQQKLATYLFITDKRTIARPEKSQLYYFQR